MKKLLCVALLLVTGCKKALQEDMSQYHAASVEKSSKDILIPRALRDIIQKEYLAFIRKENPKIVLPDAEVLDRIPREFLDIDVFFKMTAPGALSENLVFRLPRGGGLIDLKDYVTGKKGSFYMKLNARHTFEPEKNPVQALHVYYLSLAKERKIEGESFGAGCNKFMDISSYVNSSNEEGIRLNATAQRYLSVVAGTFYFVDFNPERKIYLAAVKFTDSKHPELLCE